MKNGIKIESTSSQLIKITQIGHKAIKGTFFVSKVNSVVKNSTSYSCDITSEGLYEIYCGYRKINGKKVTFFIDVKNNNGILEYSVISKHQAKLLNKQI